VHPEFVHIGQATESIKGTAVGFLASATDNSDPRPAERFTPALTSNANDGGLF